MRAKAKGIAARTAPSALRVDSPVLPRFPAPASRAGSRSTLLNDLLRIRPPAAEEPREESAVTRGDELTVDEHVELSGVADLELALDARRRFKVRSETRRAIAKASSLAVENLHVHGSFSSSRTCPSSDVRRRSVRHRGHPPGGPLRGRILEDLPWLRTPPPSEAPPHPRIGSSGKRGSPPSPTDGDAGGGSCIPNTSVKCLMSNTSIRIVAGGKSA